MAKKTAKAGRATAGNVEYDLGEEVERKLRAGGLAGSRPGHVRPGMYGGYRPFYAGSGSGHWALGAKLGIPRQVNTGKFLGGGLLGSVGTRILRRVVPGLLGTDSQLAVDGVNAVALALPFLFKRNDLTVGIAAPAVFQLAFDLADWGLDAVGLDKPSLSGGLPRGVHGPSGNPRLRNVYQRMQPPQQRAAFAGQPVRVVSQPRG